MQRAARRHAHAHRAAGHPAGHGRAHAPARHAHPARHRLRPAAHLPARPALHRIAIRQFYGLSEFYDLQSGEKFTPRGVNYFDTISLLAQNGANTFGVTEADWLDLEAAFQRLRAAGYNTLRLYLDSCASGPGCILQDDGASFNPAYLDNLARLMNLAQDNGLFLLLASVDLPAQSRYAELAEQGSSEQFAAYRNSYYLTEQGVQAYRAYWGDLLAQLARARCPLRNRAGLGAGG